MTIEDRISERNRVRAEVAGKGDGALWLISESIDDYIEHRIQADKLLEGILKDIQGNTATIAELRMEKILAENLN